MTSWASKEGERNKWSHKNEQEKGRESGLRIKKLIRVNQRNQERKIKKSAMVYNFIRLLGQTIT